MLRPCQKGLTLNNVDFVAFSALKKILKMKLIKMKRTRTKEKTRKRLKTRRFPTTTTTMK
jgi:hypothetical protein